MEYRVRYGNFRSVKNMLMEPFRVSDYGGEKVKMNLDKSVKKRLTNGMFSYMINSSKKF